jgi:thioredoxin-like negative regulator of GroEL
MKLLKFSARWCSPCTTLTRFLIHNKIDHTTIDIDEQHELAAKYQIRSLPTIVCVDDMDAELWRVVGLDLKSLKEKL